MKKTSKKSMISILYIVFLILFAVSVSAANYSIGEYVRDSSNVTLYTGWNMFSLEMEQGDNSSNITIPLVGGKWNLIGYSSEKAIHQQNVNFTNQTGTEKAWSTAVLNRDVQKQFAFYDNNGITKKYKYTPLQVSNLSSKRGYWIRSNKDGNVTIKGVGGSFINQTYKWYNLMFTNGSDRKNISDALDAGWIGETGMDISYIIYYFDPTYGINGNWRNIPADKEDISPWEGLLVYGMKNNIKLLRQN